MQNNNGYLPQLDGLRAIAIGFVLLTHFWSYPPSLPVINNIAICGWVGVDLFFVLSGYLITGILCRSKGEDGYFRNFYGKRALRIFPLYFLLVAIVLFVLPESEQLEGIRRDWPLYTFFLSNVAVAMAGWRWLGADISWSLSVEEQFYLVWPAIVRFLNHRSMMWLCVALIVLCPIARLIAFPFMGKIPVYVLTPFRADAFAIGALIALSHADKLKAAARWTLVATVPLIAYGMIANVYEEHAAVGVVAGYSLVGLASGSFLVLALQSNMRWLSHRWLVAVGKVSFGLYIYHIIVGIVCSKLQEQLGLITGIEWLDAVLKLVAFSCASLAVAVVSYHVFEQRFLRLKSHFEPKKIHALSATQ